MLNAVPKHSQLAGISRKTQVECRGFQSILPECYITANDLFYFPNYSLCILDSKVRDDKIRAGEMNQIKHSDNIIGLCTEFCYSKTALQCRVVIPLPAGSLRLKTSTDEGRKKNRGEAEYRSGRWGWIGFRCKHSAHVRGIWKGLWGSAGSDAGGRTGWDTSGGNKFNQKHDNGRCFYC